MKNELSVKTYYTYCDAELPPDMVRFTICLFFTCFLHSFLIARGNARTCPVRRNEMCVFVLQYISVIFKRICLAHVRYFFFFEYFTPKTEKLPTTLEFK